MSESSQNAGWLRALLDMLPLSIAVAPWGLLCGSLAIQAGLDIWQAQAMSALVFAGAAQLSGVAMLGAGTAAGPLLSTTFMISARHLLYSASLRQYVLSLPPLKRCVLAFLLTDEMFALASAQLDQDKRFDPGYAIKTGFLFFLGWNMATAAGIALGQYPGLESLGLDFAIAATFIALLVPMIRCTATLICVLSSVAFMLLGTWLQWAQALPVAVIGAMTIAYLLDRKLRPKEAPQATLADTLREEAH